MANPHIVDEPFQPLQQVAFSSQLPMDLLIVEIRELHRETAGLRRGQEELLRVSRRQFCRVNQVINRMDTFLDYSSNFNSALSNMFNTPSVNLGTGPFHFPAPHLFPEYTLDTEDEDDDT